MRDTEGPARLQRPWGTLEEDRENSGRREKQWETVRDREGQERQQILWRLVDILEKG